MGDKIYAKARFAYNNKPLKWWEEKNPILENGEPSFVSDGKDGEWLKIGDGVTAWNDLPWKKVTQPIDQTYNSESKNAQSGKAVAEAISDKPTLYTGTRYSIDVPSATYFDILIEEDIPYKVGDLYFNTDKKQLLVFTVAENRKSSVSTSRLNYKGLNFPVDATYNSESPNAQSGKATAEGIALSVGDINAVLATVISGSAVLPQSIINKVVEKAAAGVEKQVGGRFITAVAVKDTGSIEVEPNAAYFIISNSESGKITVYDRTTEEPVEFTGKMIGMITGNYGDTNPSSVLGLVGIYSSAIIRKGTYLAIDSSKTATFSWTGEATVVTVKNVKGE